MKRKFLKGFVYPLLTLVVPGLATAETVFLNCQFKLEYYQESPGPIRVVEANKSFALDEGQIFFSDFTLGTQGFRISSIVGLSEGTSPVLHLRALGFNKLGSREIGSVEPVDSAKVPGLKISRFEKNGAGQLRYAYSAACRADVAADYELTPAN
ncbi:MAG: hypothetical protein AB7P04_12865 [Bacteriovoracia bacterium]